MDGLKGKSVSVPIGSSSHKMLLEIMEQNDLSDTFDILHQDVAVSSTLLKTNKVDAFAIWEPYCSYLTSQGIAEVLIDGVTSESDYLTGIIIEESWGRQNSDILVVFLECLLQAHELLRNNPQAAAKIIETESSFDSFIAEKIISNIRWDAVFYENDKKTLENSVDFLVEHELISDFQIRKFLNNTLLDDAINNKDMIKPNVDLKEWPHMEY